MSVLHARIRVKALGVMGEFPQLLRNAFMRMADGRETSTISLSRGG